MDINGKRIMITCGGGVGDLIMYTPALRKLKQQYNCYLMILTPRNADVLMGLPYIDEIVYMKRGTLLGKIKHLNKLKNVDALIMTDWQPNVLLAAKLYGIPLVAGYPREGKLLSKVFTRELRTKWYKSHDFVACTHAKMISEALEIELKLNEDDLHCDVAKPNKSDEINVNNLLKDVGISLNQKFCILAPFASSVLRDWPVESSASLADMIIKRYKLPVVTIGSPDKRETAEDISNYNLVGRTNFSQLVELISRAKFMVTTDSGQMHVAGALQVPVIPIFSKDLPSRWAPKKNCWPVFLGYKCSPCNDSVAQKCKKSDKACGCLYGITAELVFEECSKHDDIIK